MHLDLDYPDAAADLNRFLPIVKWLLAIPHYIVLVVLWVVALVVTVVAWFAILITGRYPRPLFDFVLGVSRWSAPARGGLYVAAHHRPLPALPLRAVGLVGLGVANSGGRQLAEFVRGVGAFAFDLDRRLGEEESWFILIPPQPVDGADVGLAARDVEVVHALEVEPELRGHAQGAADAQRGVGAATGRDAVECRRGSD